MIFKAEFNPKPYFILSAINALLLAVTALAGVFIPQTYVNFVEPLHLAESQGQDLSTLLIGLPLLGFALRWTRRGSVKGPLFWAGAQGYFLYVNLIYAYGGVYNPLFFAYVAICGLSLFSLIGILSGIDANRVMAQASPLMPFKSIAAYFMGTAALLTVMWGAMAVSAIIAGQTADANVIIVTDFIIVIPAYVLAAVWLLKRKPWGMTLSGILLVQAVTLGFSIVAGQGIALVKGLKPVWGLAGFFLAFTLMGLILTLRYTRHLRHDIAE